MRTLHRAELACLVALGVAGCGRIPKLAAPATVANGIDFSVVAALGTSISAGVQSGGMVDRHQAKSFPVLFAHQVGSAAFTWPHVTDDGYQPLLRLISLSPLVISNAGERWGVPTNLSQPTAYHHMGVPGALLTDVLSAADYGRDSVQAVRFAYTVRGRGTMLSEVASLSPSFVTFEMGSNELLGPAIEGSGVPGIPPATWAPLLHATLDSLQERTHARIAIFTVPDVTTIPFVITIPPYLVDPATRQPVRVNGQLVPLIGTSGPLDPADHVLLTAAELLAGGTGVPVSFGGTGAPLPDDVVLTAAEAASLQSAVVAYNTAIRAEAAVREEALVDLNGLLDEAATTGLHFRGTTYTNAFVTGGLFSLDGIHPNDLAHGFLCNRLIDAVNARFGSRIPPVDLSAAASASSSAMREARDARGLPVIENGRAVLQWLAPHGGPGPR